MPLESSEIEILKNELQVVQHKLTSKCEALLIITHELNTMRNERDQFKSLAEQIQARYGKLKKQMLLQNSAANSGSSFAECTSTGFELEDLQMKLQDANETIRMLRNQLSVLQAGKANIERIQLRKEMEESIARTTSPRASVSSSDHGEDKDKNLKLDESDVVKQLETIRIENKQLVRDLQVVLEEKEALTIERDAFRSRLSRYEVDNPVESLQHTELAELRAQIELLTNENRLLNSRSRQLETDRNNLSQTLNSYKQLLQAARSTGAVPATSGKATSAEPEGRSSLKESESTESRSKSKSASKNHASANSSSNSGSSALDRPFPGLADGAAFSLRRVKFLIDPENAPKLLEKPRDSITELQSLSRLLVEHVQDKQLANVHQRKINKFLAGRLHEYEERDKNLRDDMSQSPDERTSESGSQEPGASAQDGSGRESVADSITRK